MAALPAALRPLDSIYVQVELGRDVDAPGDRSVDRAPAVMDVVHTPGDVLLARLDRERVADPDPLQDEDAVLTFHFAFRLRREPVRR